MGRRTHTRHSRVVRDLEGQIAPRERTTDAPPGSLRPAVGDTATMLASRLSPLLLAACTHGLALHPCGPPNGQHPTFDMAKVMSRAVRIGPNRKQKLMKRQKEWIGGVELGGEHSSEDVAKAVNGNGHAPPNATHIARA